MNRETSIVVAAGVLAAAILGSAFAISRSVDSATRQLADLRGAVARAPSAAPAAAPVPSGRPDPAKRYRISLDGSPSKGPASAKITLVEFSDFQCPYCARVAPVIERIHEAYPDDVRIVFKHYPLSMHPKAPAAHAAAEAAHLQGKFWEMHDAIFADQPAMSPQRYVEYARKLGLDVNKFQADVKSKTVVDRVAADMREASKVGSMGTPSFLVNGRYVSGAKPFESFKALIDQELGRS